MKTLTRVTDKKKLLNASLVLLQENCSYPIFVDGDVYKVSKYDLQFVHRLEAGSCFNACLYDHYAIEYLGVDDVNSNEGTSTRAYYSLGFSILA